MAEPNNFHAMPLVLVPAAVQREIAVAVPNAVAGPSTSTRNSVNGHAPRGQGGRGKGKQPHFKNSTDSLASNSSAKRSKVTWSRQQQGEEAGGSNCSNPESWRREIRLDLPQHGLGMGGVRGMRGNRGSRGGRGGQRGFAGRGHGGDKRGGAQPSNADLNELLKELSVPAESSVATDDDLETLLKNFATKFSEISLDCSESEDSFQDAQPDPLVVDGAQASESGAASADSENPQSETLRRFNQYKQDKANSESASARKVNWVDGSHVGPKKPSTLEPRRFVRGIVSDEIKQKVAQLPIAAKKEELLKLVMENQIVLLRGDTGSGKSTQVPVFLAEAGYGASGRICSTQPRRLAATSLARRVSAETGTELGTLVGYAVRFDKAVKSSTMIKYVTDGMLLKEFTLDPLLSKYSVVIVDEAHERSDHTDVCLALLNRLIKKGMRPDLKLIVSSATLDVVKFKHFFNGAPLLDVQVEEHMSPYKYEILYDKTDRDYLQGAVDKVLEILGVRKEGSTKSPRRIPIGDILVFLCGEDEIFQTMGKLRVEINRCKPEKEVDLMPCFGGMTLQDQEKIFSPTEEGHVKVILATNIAETSLTIDGIVSVVDGGYQKEDNYDHKSGVGSLTYKRISQEQAIQRAGRVGRTREGIVHRLYTRKTFENEMAKSSTPEIQRSNIDGLVLDLIAMGLDFFELEFIDKPVEEKVLDALEHLQELEALDSNLAVTNAGKVMSHLPVDPPLAKALLKAFPLGCLKEMLVVVSMLSTKHTNLFRKPKGEKARKVQELKNSFANSNGDLCSYLSLWNKWKAEGFDRKWNEDCVNVSLLVEAHDIHKQLESILAKIFPQPFSSCGDDLSKIGKALCSGLFRKVAVRSPKSRTGYVTCGGSGVEGNEALVHPSSYLSKDFVPTNEQLPKLVLYHQLFRTTRPFLSGLHAVEATWVLQYGLTGETCAVRRIKDLFESCGLLGNNSNTN